MLLCSHEAQISSTIQNAQSSFYRLQVLCKESYIAQDVVTRVVIVNNISQIIKITVSKHMQFWKQLSIC